MIVKKILLVLFLLLFCFCVIFYTLSREDIDCSTIKKEENGGIVGCDLTVDLDARVMMRVVNLKRYWFVFNKYLFVDLVQKKSGKNIHSIYMARVFNDSVGIQFNVRHSNVGISTQPDESKNNLDIKELAEWLDRNDFKNKQVVALLYREPNKKQKYLIGISVYADDVKN